MVTSRELGTSVDRCSKPRDLRTTPMTSRRCTSHRPFKAPAGGGGPGHLAQEGVNTANLSPSIPSTHAPRCLVDPMEREKVFAEATSPGDLFLRLEGCAPAACSASVSKPRPELLILQSDSSVLQVLQLPKPCFSVALTAQVEVHHSDDGQRNRLWATVPFHRVPDKHPGAMSARPWNQCHWGQDKALRPWIRDSRLGGFGKPIDGIDPQDAEKRAIAARLKEQGQATMANMDRPIGGSD